MRCASRYKWTILAYVSILAEVTALCVSLYYSCGIAYVSATEHVEFYYELRRIYNLFVMTGSRRSIAHRGYNATVQQLQLISFERSLVLN